ncbi:flagellin [Endozoicomonas sp. SM1973]|uniref:Flagellin n=1 Tax=Spartinivicinus marinus TaxID=2994442 RepID=A0A853HV37_9GAMM|nr:flagellin [Spartinivicinus marinus]MCX4029539.1 flagellin [Spartinivicinus marinus]NYZ65113.1 flagellin [Spartinivicinus marinus]
MPQVINTNVTALIAQRTLNSTQQAEDNTLSRLASGLRVNSTKDDAAGFAISIRFDSHIRGSAIAIRNANDGISLAQTAEGAFTSVINNLQRVRELALQSANSSNTEVDRIALNEEIIQLIDEIQTVAKNTNFNSKNLLDGSLTNTLFQTGGNLGEAIPLSIAKVTTDSLGSALADGISSTRPGALTTLGSGDLVINRIPIAAPTGIDDNASTHENERSAIAIAAAINKSADLTEVTARANPNVVGYSGFLAATNATVNGAIVINNISINVSTNVNLDANVNRESVISTINNATGQTGVRAVNTGNINTGITLIADDGRNIRYDDNGSGLSAAVAIAAAATQTYVGSYTLVAKNQQPITIDFGQSDIGRFTGLAFGTYSGGNSGVVGRRVSTSALSTGDLVINGIAVGPSLTAYDTASSVNNGGSAIAKAFAINLVKAQTGVTATVLPTVVYARSVNPGNDRNESVEINGVTIGLVFTAADSESQIIDKVVTAVNRKSGRTGITAEVFGDSFRLIAPDGRNVNLANETANANDAGFNVPSIGANTAASIQLLSAGKIEISTNNPFLSIDRVGFRVGTYGNLEQGQLLQHIDVTSVEGANLAIKAVDNAIEQIAFQQAKLGAIQNRFLSAINNLQVNNENLASAKSRIVDADFAAETATFSRIQVLQQAGISVLAQANAKPQQVLELLQF